MPTLFSTIDRYVAMDEELRKEDGRVFVSDWNGVHAHVERYLGAWGRTPVADCGDVSRYAEYEEDGGLHAKVRRFHERRDGTDLDEIGVLTAGGSTGVLGALGLWLLQQGIREVHYVAPLYYSLAMMLRSLGIAAHRVSSGHAYEQRFDLDLPGERTVLLLSDPVWYAGRRVPAGVLDEIGAWQERTASTVFVDGTFQYLRWDGTGAERSARLDPARTLRLVCPTKALSIHGFRFAYLLVPQALREDLCMAYDTVHGPSGVVDHSFAHRAMDVLLGEESNRAVVEEAKANYQRLRAEPGFGEHVAPDCAYFVFCRLAAPPERYIAMDQGHFELTGYPGYVRVNLLNEAALALVSSATGTDRGGRVTAVRVTPGG